MSSKIEEEINGTSNSSVLSENQDLENNSLSTENSSVDFEGLHGDIKAEISKNINQYILNQQVNTKRLEDFENTFFEEIKKVRDWYTNLGGEFNKFKEQIRMGMFGILQTERSLREEIDQFNDKLKELSEKKLQVELDNLNKLQEEHYKRITLIEQFISNSKPNVSLEEFNKFRNQIKDIFDGKVKIELENINNLQDENFKRITHIEQMISNLNQKEELDKFKHQIKDFLDKKAQTDFENINILRDEQDKRIVEIEQIISKIKQTISIIEFNRFKKQIRDLQVELENFNKFQDEHFKRITILEQIVTNINHTASKEEFDNFKTQIKELFERKVEPELENINKLQDEHYKRLIYIEQFISELNPSTTKEQEEFDNFKTQIKELFERKVETELENINKLQDEHYKRLIYIEQFISELNPPTTKEQLENFEDHIKEFVEKMVQVEFRDLTKLQDEHHKRIRQIEHFISSANPNPSLKQFKNQIEELIETTVKAEVNNLNKIQKQHFTLEKKDSSGKSNYSNDAMKEVREELVEGVRMLSKRISKTVDEMNKRFEELQEKLEVHNQMDYEKKNEQDVNLLKDKDLQVVSKNAVDKLTQFFKKQSQDIKKYVDDQQLKIVEIETLLKRYNEENTKQFVNLNQRTIRNQRIFILGIGLVVIFIIAIKFIL